MTTQEEYAAIGKAHADLREAKERLRALKLAAGDLGRELMKVGRLLANEPELTGLSEEFPASLETFHKAEAFDRNIFDADKFRNLTSEIRECMEKIRKLESTLRS